MKRIYVWLALFAIGYFLFTQTPLGTKAYNIWYSSPCDTPLPYKIGSIDERFGISKEELATDVTQAATVWNTVYGKPVFTYDEKAELTIGMVYDKRQSLNSEISKLQSQLDSQEQSLKPQELQYDRDSAAFRQKLAEFNKQVEYWNNRGGAPKEEYDKLKAQQQELQKEADRLNEMARSLNRSVQSYNTQLGTLNQQVDTFNAALAEKPEEGLYDSGENTITIYLTNSHNELIHTLAHELGHALGMGHVEEKTSVMYPLTSASITPSDADIDELRKVCSKRTLLEKYQTRLLYIVDFYRNRH